MTVRQHDQVKVLAYVAAAERARLANEDKAKAALELCADVVRAEFPAARYVTLAVEDDDGPFVNGVRRVEDADEKPLLEVDFNADYDDELQQRLLEAPWDDLVSDDGEEDVDLEEGML